MRHWVFGRVIRESIRGNTRRQAFYDRRHVSYRAFCEEENLAVGCPDNNWHAFAETRELEHVQDLVFEVAIILSTRQQMTSMPPRFLTTQMFTPSGVRVWKTYPICRAAFTKAFSSETTVAAMNSVSTSKFYGTWARCLIYDFVGLVLFWDDCVANS